MKSTINHIQINVSDKNISFPFYKELLSFLGFAIVHEDEQTLGMSNGSSDIWLGQTDDRFISTPFHRKHTGLNHIAFKVDSKEGIDLFSREFLQKKGIKTLYSSPKAFPEYTPDYYAVFFEDPDRVKLEVVFL